MRLFAKQRSAAHPAGMSRTIWYAGTAVALAAALVIPAAAPSSAAPACAPGTIKTQSFTASYEGMPSWTATLKFPKFDNAGGTRILTSAKLVRSGMLDANLTVWNQSRNTSQRIDPKVAGSVSMSWDGPALNDLTFEHDYEPVTLEPNEAEYWLGWSPGAGVVYPRASVVDRKQMTWTSPKMLKFFSGPGEVVFTSNARFIMSAGEQGGNIATQVSSKMSTSAKVVYQYVCMPA